MRQLCDWARQRGRPVWVRLVKGAYWDYETIVAAQENWPIPVYQHKAETDANFEAQTAFLIEHHRLLRPAMVGVAKGGEGPPEEDGEEASNEHRQEAPPPDRRD